MATTAAYAPLNQTKTLYAEGGVEVSRPALPLAEGAVEISGYGPEEQIYRIMQNLTRYWASPALNTPPLTRAFFCLERRDAAQSKILRQVIPYPFGGVWSYLRQIQVVWNANAPGFMSFANSRLLGRQEELEAALRDDRQASQEQALHGSDPFCQQAQLAKQQVFEGRHVRVLYNFKPLSPLDFLIVPKEHCETFEQVKQEAFVEAMRIGSALSEHFKGPYPISYLNHANGKAAGQTVMHWHLHVTMAAGKVDEIWGSLKVVGKMLGVVKPLSDQTLARRIDQLRADLSSIIQTYGS